MRSRYFACICFTRFGLEKLEHQLRLRYRYGACFTLFGSAQVTVNDSNHLTLLIAFEFILHV